MPWRRTNKLKSFKVLVAAGSLAVLLAGCTPSLPPRDQFLSSSQSSGQSEDSFDLAEELQWREGRRYATYPMVQLEVPGAPFSLWAPPDAVGEFTEAIEQESLAAAAFDESTKTSLTLEGTALALLDDGSLFGAGATGDPGVFSSDGTFTPLQELVPQSNTFFLPESSGYESLSAVAAAGAARAEEDGQIVVWLATGRGSDWSLFSWDSSAGVVTELASQASMSVSSVTSNVELPSEPTLSTSGQYTYFNAVVPKELLGSPWYGGRLHEFVTSGDDLAGQEEAAFRVSLRSPGDVVYLGSDLTVAADPYFTSGLFSASLEPGGDVLVDEAPQSGSESLKLDLSLENTCAPLTGSPCYPQLRVASWSDDEGVEPVIGLEPAAEWLLTDLEAGERYLVGTIVSEGSERQDAWLFIWDLEQIQLRALIQTNGTAKPTTTGESVVWVDDTGAFLWSREIDSLLPGAIQTLTVPAGGGEQLGPLVSHGLIGLGSKEASSETWLLLQTVR